tara:strand:- start:3681 stop:4499 length:819 start_codon:yes stop_codon:yes gene_type:complete
MGLLMQKTNFFAAQEWFEFLREELIKEIELIDGKRFIISNWKHKPRGGGKSSKILGNIIEKGGVNISSVSGKFTDKMKDKIPGTKNDPSYKATGISVVLHPLSPKIPSMHFNTRFLQTEQIWFGGGIDITPCLPFEYEKKYHLLLKDMCDKFDKNYYSKYKKWCDDYFFLPHRNEPRGIGGIFFDYLNTKNLEKDFEFVKETGIFFKNFVINTLNQLKDEKWTSEEKEIQLIKRSRYVEFNLLHDRGTRFGLETGGNIDAILMSMPPLAKWE